MRAIITILLLMISGMIYAQRPTHIPDPSEPFNVLDSVATFIFYIVLPIIIIVLYIIWRRRINKQKKEEEQESGNHKNNN